MYGCSVVQKCIDAATGAQQEALLETCPLCQDMWRAHIGAKDWAVSSGAKEA